MKCNRAIFRETKSVVVTLNPAERRREPVECGGTLQGYYLEDLHMGYICDRCFTVTNPDVGVMVEAPSDKP